ncbi:hypothetical protein A3K72_02210 [Candidatus Woesearchaeota archaeon RBG_13_36_6]|nr:MAG: hypothetical protein A3K72_02210 [Candidatus Woesearchaeota archaeon RBG_13_36_6]
MGIFKDMLGAGETLFKNPVALDYDYVPKLIPYRENEQFRIANCIKPLFQRRNGRNLLIYGKPGVGKTVACKHVLKELEEGAEEAEEITPIYINCWQRNTSFKILLEICDKLGYRLTHNKKTDELLAVVVKTLNKGSAVLVFDEIDKIDDYDFLYHFLEQIYRKCIILITNHKEWVIELDDRVKSRLLPEMLEFKPYNLSETKGILKQRADSAFYEGVLDDTAFELITKKTYELQDIRSGLYLLREAGNAAEDKSSKKISLEHTKTAIEKLDKFKIKKSTELEDETKTILELVKQNSGKRIGDIFKIYQDKGGKLVYKSFQRKINKLYQGNYIEVAKTKGGKLGNTSIIKYSKDVKKLTDF